jgi:hypothetical protein
MSSAVSEPTLSVARPHRRHSLATPNWRTLGQVTGTDISNTPLYMSNDNSHVGVVELLPHFDKFREFRRWI